MSQGTCANPVLSSSLSPFSTRGICRDMVHDSAGWVNLCGEDYRCPREKTIELNSPLCDDRNSPPDTCLFSFYQAYLPMAKQVDPLGSIPNSSQHNNSVASTRPPSNHLTAAAVLDICQTIRAPRCIRGVCFNASERGPSSGTHCPAISVEP